MHRQILYIDLDEVIVDFYNHPCPNKSLAGWDRTKRNPPAMYEKGFFRNLKPLPGALEAVRRILRDPRFDVYILTQPVAETPHSYSEKAEWIAHYLPELTHKITMTQNKLLSIGDFLIDDSMKWAAFQGEFILFHHNGESEKEWRGILDYLSVP